MRRRGGEAGHRKRVGEHHDGSFGVYMSHKIQKLRGQSKTFTDAAQSPSSLIPHSSTLSSSVSVSAIFQGVHVNVDGYTIPSKEEICQLMLLHGGGFEHYETSRVTHIIATHLPASKLLQLKKMKKPLPVVHPDWVVQSIKQKRVLPVQSFLYAGFADPTQSSLFSLLGSPAATGRMSVSGSTVSSSVKETPKAGTVDEDKLLAEPGQSVASIAKTAEATKVVQTLGSGDDGDWDILADEEEDEYEDSPFK
ncbi:hypothetical protein BBO99_00002297 [Phytophthora kernoviae]|uniref:BRCT domain-containing protein n=2 Tax=Phytophthora kernoviae TaxID=325452 RepID=A0A3R7KX35_9STRA|nr:hypothetical protein G195_002713 [Phytophthora kernoviae 00238/432]KAG2509789.1 hypothetical protein JM16_008649 [Phytophthora kernoviae]KAG2530490.1 hypothetical protein JM18_002086 [Phytophthora kernoviae]RLN10681.1 hypothetical protein BBI17_002169 [Phytophthora kernoviae]RLN83248.1 hypothetical protein BBO99_00002297 [Phytophthora kernoviae]